MGLIVDNLGEFLNHQNLTISFRKNYNPNKFHHHAYFHVDVDVDVDVDECRLNNLPDDTLCKIVGYLNLTEFIRLRVTCKSLNRASQRLLESTKVGHCLLKSEPPWLLLPHDSKKKKLVSLTFYNMSECKIQNIKLPNIVRGGWCSSSCKGGWVTIIKKPKRFMFQQFEPDIFLVNPISGQTLRLPPISTIPEIDYYAYEELDSFFGKLDFSGQSPAEPDCIIAGVFSINKIAFCMIGSDSWITPFGFDEEVYNTDILFSADGTTIYAIMDTVGENPLPASIQTTKTLSFTFQDKVHTKVINLKSIIPKFLNSVQKYTQPEIDIILGENLGMIENYKHHAYFLETSNRNLLLILKTFDLMTKLTSDDEENQHQLPDDNDKPCFYLTTKGLKILNFDPDTNEVSTEVTELDKTDDVIFLGTGCFSMSSINFTNGLIPTSNSIYFHDDYLLTGDRFDDHLKSFVSRESGVFNLHTQRINRCFPSVRFPMLSKMFWFMPSF